MRASKKSLFEACEHNQVQADPLSVIYGTLRDDSQARGKRTYVWAELLHMFQRRFTVSMYMGSDVPSPAPVTQFES